MKKKLVASLAAAMVLGVAGTSFAAANPFTDVPAKHWAYDSVMKLAQAGVVDGYGDGTYRGDKLISRYEMAQMVAKAMARSDKADAAQKAAIDKLAVEFAAELNNLGVRVGALEKKVGTVAVSGDLRVRFTHTENAADNSQTKERFRLNMKADVNDTTSFNGRFMVLGHNEFGKNNGNTDLIADASMTTKKFMGTDAVFTVGRYSESALATGYYLGTTGFMDGAKISFGNKLKATVGYADLSNFNIAGVGGGLQNVEDLAYLTASYAPSKATTLYGLYGAFKRVGNMNPDVIGLGVASNLSKTLATKVDWNRFEEGPVSATGFVAQLNYKGANKAQPQTFGLGLEYKKFEPNAMFNYGDYNSTSMTSLVDIKNFVLSANYTLQKNVVLSAYQTFNSKNAAGTAEKAEFTRVQVDFNF